MRSRALRGFLAIGVVVLGVRVLGETGFHQSALLYILGPFLIAVILSSFQKNEKPKNVNQEYSKLVLDSLVVMLGSSILLQEGFLCVVMFMPLYFFMVCIGYVISKSFELLDGKNKTVSSHIFPIVIVALSLEGVTPDLSFNRDNVASASRIVELSVSEIKNNLIKPINLQQDRSLLLKLFPMPSSISAGSLQQGDIHRINYDYYKWFVTNIHQGYMLLKISEVGDTHVKTEIIEDTSYISNYIGFKGTLITFEEVDKNKTKVNIKIYYSRLLDPVWYFQPLQQYAISLMGGHLIDSIMDQA